MCVWDVLFAQADAHSRSRIMFLQIPALATARTLARDAEVPKDNVAGWLHTTHGEVFANLGGEANGGGPTSPARPTEACRRHIKLRKIAAFDTI